VVSGIAIGNVVGSNIANTSPDPRRSDRCRWPLILPFRRDGTSLRDATTLSAAGGLSTGR
jgi:hypothetical protein